MNPTARVSSNGPFVNQIDLCEYSVDYVRRFHTARHSPFCTMLYAMQKKVEEFHSPQVVMEPEFTKRFGRLPGIILSRFITHQMEGNLEDWLDFYYEPIIYDKSFSDQDITKALEVLEQYRGVQLVVFSDRLFIRVRIDIINEDFHYITGG